MLSFALDPRCFETNFQNDLNFKIWNCCSSIKKNETVNYFAKVHGQRREKEEKEREREWERRRGREGERGNICVCIYGRQSDNINSSYTQFLDAFNEYLKSRWKSSWNVEQVLEILNMLKLVLKMFKIVLKMLKKLHNCWK